MTQTLRVLNQTLLLGVITVALGACGNSGSDSAGSGGKGGASSASASAAGGSGGKASASSSVTSGGASSGGASSSGGQSSASATGGSSGPGGSSALGGSTTSSAEGGQSAQTGGQGGNTGGTSKTGGTTGAGGTGTGGSKGTGGTGGGTGSQASATGGTSANGGTSGDQGGSGGGTGAGGTTASGGTTADTCPPMPALAAGDTTRTIKSGGKDRTYVLHVPAGYTGNKAVPLLVDFHPHGSTGPNWRKDTPYVKLADADGVISAFPSAIGDWNVGPCCADGVDDVGFAKDMVKEIKGLACIDGKRVYAAGFSMGGGMTNYVACHAADVFAAFAPAAFALLQEVVPDCKPGRPITVVAFQGTSDPYVPYAGGLSNLVKPINFLGAVDAMKKWAELSGCTGSAADIGNGCQGYAASQCKGEEVVLCTKQGGQHEAANANLTWPILKKHAMP